VPCSGEGTFRFPTEHRWYTETKRKTKFPVLWKRIILRGFDLLQERGVMVYSTCTHNPEENKGIEDGHVILRHEEDILGLGLLMNDEICSQLPRHYAGKLTKYKSIIQLT
jgi:16S rRNA C967 or C1407 C5-methylase (RsmB/RsmF family)